MSSDGAQGDSTSSRGAISEDGRFVAFRSGATNLVDDDTNGEQDVFVHDLLTGETTRVSVSSRGREGNGKSGVPLIDISGDGRFVVFDSYATNLVPHDRNRALDVFVHDRWTKETTRVSVSSSGEEAAGGACSISADGRYVAFSSGSDKLVEGDTNNDADVFVHDRETGETTRVSLSTDGEQGEGHSGSARISPNGRYVAFGSQAENLVDGDTNNRKDVFLHDRETGQTIRVSVSSSGGQGNADCSVIDISADGRYVTFTSTADNLVEDDTNVVPDGFVHDRVTGQTTRFSVSSSGAQSHGNTSEGYISADGRFIAFSSDAIDLVDDDNTFEREAFLRDQFLGVTIRVSLSSEGEPANERGRAYGVSGDGRRVVMAFEADNLVEDDTNGWPDVFVRLLGPVPIGDPIPVEAKPGD